ncbi:TraR/DksA family transcriptional regulator [Tessaracoccus rhinocerotis]|uniref:TraR/DksA family transcriptional regulator n=1 Tax=Tessaracoccus rhinocerotis TaxID=1689449 RepID=A0A553K4N2_9ACTN|nr:TraR/DksA C4-type zinc finger protein [Tessaracoccus rhinocerotis]TRY19668.1 TraR/DksA family transcriptional regulator [Tessaracoccus rhinocerotis]
MDNIDPALVAEALDTKADELRARIEELTRPPEAGATIGFGKRIGDGTIQAVQQLADSSTAESLQRTLNEVVDARARLEAGEYGRCVVCGEPIPAARLEFRPWAATCVQHAG